MVPFQTTYVRPTRPAAGSVHPAHDGATGAASPTAPDDVGPTVDILPDSSWNATSGHASSAICDYVSCSKQHACFVVKSWKLSSSNSNESLIRHGCSVIGTEDRWYSAETEHRSNIEVEPDLKWTNGYVVRQDPIISRCISPATHVPIGSTRSQQCRHQVCSSPRRQQ